MLILIGRTAEHMYKTYFAIHAKNSIIEYCLLGLLKCRYLQMRVRYFNSITTFPCLYYLYQNHRIYFTVFYGNFCLTVAIYFFTKICKYVAAYDAYVLCKYIKSCINFYIELVRFLLFMVTIHAKFIVKI